MRLEPVCWIVASSCANVSRLIVSVGWLKDEDDQMKQPRYSTKLRVGKKPTRITDCYVFLIFDSS